MTNLDGWDYEFRSWKNITGFEPIELIASVDESESYEMDRRHVFLLADGKYASVDEQGCSCYDPSWASVEIHPTKESAFEAARIPPSA